MNERKIKSLFSLSIENAELRINCVQYTITKKVSVMYDIRSRYKHSKKEIKRSNRDTSVCDTLKQHARDLKNDPERLSTEFMQKIIGVKCE